MDKAFQTAERYAGIDIKQVMTGGFWVITAKAITVVSSLLVMIAFARLAPPETFGSYQFILSVVGIFSILSLPGLTVSIIRGVAQGSEGILRHALREKLLWGSLGSLGLFLVSVWYFMHSNTTLALPFLVAAALLPFFKGFEIHQDFWNGREEFKGRTKNIALASLFSSLSLILTLIFTNNLLVIVALFLLSNTIANGILLWGTFPALRNEKTDPETIRFGKNLTVMNAFTLISDYLDKVVLWKFLGPLSVAIYSFAQLPIKKIEEGLPILHLALPKLSSRNGDYKKSKLIKQSLLILVGILPLVAILFFIAPVAYKVVFPAYTNAVPYFRALTLLLLFSPLLLLNSALLANTKTRELYTIRTIHPLLKILLLFVLVPPYGIWGVVFTLLVSEIIRASLTIYFVLK